MKKILMIVLLSMCSVAMADSVTYNQGANLLEVIDSSAPARMSFDLFVCTQTYASGEASEAQSIIAFNAGDALLRLVNNGLYGARIVKNANGVVVVQPLNETGDKNDGFIINSITCSN